MALRSPRSTTAPARRQSGLSLIELMVALVLGLLLLGGVLQVYLTNKFSFITQQQNGYLQESGRFAMEFFARDARMAGLTGCSSRRPPDQALPVRSYLNDTAYPYELTIGLRGHEANGSAPGSSITSPVTPTASGNAGDWTPNLPGGTYALATNAVAGSDVLVITGMAPDGIPLVAPFTSGSQIFVDDVRDIAEGDILFVTDCQQAQIFQATNVVAASDNIVGSGAGSYSPGNSGPIAEQGPEGPFQQGSEISRVRTYAYYVGVSPDSGQPALFRDTLIRGAMQPEELISGVESMQLVYGVDGDMDYVVDQYLAANAVTDWGTVRAIRVSLLLRSPEEFLQDTDTTGYELAGTTVTPAGDRRQRRVFTSTIALRNRLL